MADPRTRPLVWRMGPDPEFIYVADVDGQRWVIRLGDFPAEPLYTLLVDDAEVLCFDDWPATWRRPDHPGG